MAGFVVPPAPFQAPTTRVELALAAQDLADRDLFSRSDPFCVVSERAISGAWVEVGRTERLANTLNPAWTARFELDYRFEEVQTLRFQIYDHDADTTDLKQHDPLGSLEVALGRLASAPNGLFISRLQSGRGQLQIATEECAAQRDVVQLQLAARGLDRKDTFGRSDPYAVLAQCGPGGHYSVVHRTPVIKNQLSPTWPACQLPLATLCHGDYERRLRIEVYDWDQVGAHDLIGSLTTSLADLLKVAQSDGPAELPLLHPKKIGRSRYQHSGLLLVQSLRVERLPSFVDYLQGGLRMNFAVAVDFTASNGDPALPTSLHYRQAQRDNQYTRAIRAVGEIIQDYDEDRLFPALGFGAQVPPDNRVSHEFFLNLHPENPYCPGVDGVLAAYATALERVTLFGPTHFAPVIQHVARFAETYQEGQFYFVLLIITDGMVTDLEATQRAIVDASSLPISIIIVGVGEADFSAMEALDSDQGLLRAGTRVAARDIVQFVEFRKFVDAQGVGHQAGLAQEVLAEVPHQVVHWMKTRGIQPAGPR